MNSVEPLLKKIAAYQPDADLTMVRLAFDFARDAHGTQKRKSGEPYIIHPLKTAEILADMRLPLPIILAGLMHDVPEDTAITLDDIKKNFGEDVASIVRGITKLGKLKYRGIDRYVENLRKMFVAIASDARVLLVKFADRLHNLQTLSALPPDKQKRIAIESLEIYAPIANRLGMSELCARIEDLAFKYVMPEEYAWVAGLITQAVKVKASYIDKIGKLTEKILQKNGVQFIRVYGRVKHIYSLYRKLIKHERNNSRVRDLIALRIIVPNIADCYATLGMIHQQWKPFRGRIKDYIAQPKPNGYQSLHTTVFCEGGEVVEFQIRTEQMHEEAERGIAAHWHYNEDGKVSSARMKSQLAWVKDLVEQQKNIKDNSAYLESLETMKIDFFRNRIFVFTPQGDVIDLPESATPVDFAFAIHSQIGNSCTGARVNDHIVSLDHKLTSGDCCEIIIDKNRKSPNSDWLSFVKTGAARSHIRAANKDRFDTWSEKIKTVFGGSGGKKSGKK